MLFSPPHHHCSHAKLENAAFIWGAAGLGFHFPGKTRRYPDSKVMTQPEPGNQQPCRTCSSPTLCWARQPDMELGNFYACFQLAHAQETVPSFIRCHPDAEGRDHLLCPPAGHMNSGPCPWTGALRIHRLTHAIASVKRHHFWAGQEEVVPNAPPLVPPSLEVAVYGNPRWDGKTRRLQHKFEERKGAGRQGFFWRG